ncbi:MAG TPA: GDP-mannose 4,6-dehydratase [Thermoplasmata archaeon]|nr:GDP-mannose 4,6-dehydratase [Thermoplasmata archaeon]
MRAALSDRDGRDPLRALVTGGTGFLGSYMSTHLASQGTEVTATYLPRVTPKGPAPLGGIRLVPLDVTDRLQVERTVAESKPDVVYHFAGQAYVIPSWEDPLGTYATNLTGTLHLLEELRHHFPRTRFAFAGSGTEYGDPPIVPTPEDSPLLPTSPYASSKAAADLLCYQYFRSFEIPVFRYRIFGTTGPGKKGDSTNDFASQIAAIEEGPSPRVLRVGNLDRRRDIQDVRDAIRAMVTVVEKGTPGEAYNIASGVPRLVRQNLETLLTFARNPITVESAPEKIRRVDEPVHLADISRLTALGWAPSIPFEQTLRDILESWRAAR